MKCFDKYSDLYTSLTAHDIIWISVLNSSGFSVCSTSLNKDVFLSSSHMNKVTVKLPLLLCSVPWRHRGDMDHSERQD
jgi:hypothetical protein